MSIEWFMRKVLQRFWRWQRALTLGARGIVLDGDGRVLLVRHTYGRGWILPGGGVEFREPISTSLIRELDEEAGIAVTGPPELLGIYANHAIFPGDHVAIYVVRGWRQARTFKPNAEIAAAEFFPIEALPEGTSEGTRRRLDEMLGRRPKQDVW